MCATHTHTCVLTELHPLLFPVCDKARSLARVVVINVTNARGPDSDPVNIYVAPAAQHDEDTAPRGSRRSQLHFASREDRPLGSITLYRHDDDDM